MRAKWNSLGLLVALSMILSLVLMPALAENNLTPTRTTTLDLSIYSQTTDMLEQEGWKWEPLKDGGVLTLRNCYVKSNSVSLLEFADHSTVTIVLEGQNVLETTAVVLNPMISDNNSQSSIHYIIKEGSSGGSLSIKAPSTDPNGFNPYGFAGASIKIESGTISSNVDFCVIGEDFTMTGGHLIIDALEYGIYTNSGNITINDGILDIKAGNTGIWTVGLNVDPNGSRNVVINGGTVKIEAGNSGIQTFAQGKLNDTCDVYLKGGDVDITSKAMGIAAKSIFIDSVGKVKVHGARAALYANQSNVPGRIEINQAAELSLTGGAITLPEKSSEDGSKVIVIRSANYAHVDAAIAKANALNSNHYLDFSAVTAAIGKVDRTKNILEQAKVDAMAKAIEDAIAALQYKDADYSMVDAALAKANALNRDAYKDFSAVEAAINAVVRGKNISEQSIVDAMAKAIEDAIAALKPIDILLPQTGDSSQLILWLAMGILSITTLLVIARAKKMRN